MRNIIHKKNNFEKGCQVWNVGFSFIDIQISFLDYFGVFSDNLTIFKVAPDWFERE